MEIVKTLEHEYAFLLNEEQLDDMIDSVQFYVDTFGGVSDNHFLRQRRELLVTLRDVKRQH